MPLTAFVNEQLRGLRAFCDDPERVLLDLRVDPEMVHPVSRLVASLQDEEEAEDLLVACSAPFAGPEAFYSALEEALREELAEAAAVMAEDGVELALPDGMDPELTAPGLTVEHRFAAFCEEVVRELRGLLRNLVLVINLERVAEPEQCRGSLARLLAATGCGRLKYIVLSDRQQAPLAGLEPAAERGIWAEPGADEALSPLLERLLAEPACRYLELGGGGTAGDRAAEALEQPGLKAGHRYLALEARLAFIAAPPFYRRAAELIVEQCQRLEQNVTGGSGAAGLLPQVRQPVAREDAEWAFVELCDRLAGASLSAGAVLVVRLEPRGDPRNRLVTESLERLRRACVSPRVKLVVSWPRPGGPPAEQRAPVVSQTFDLGADRIHQGLEERLQDPELGATERLRYTMALSAHALANGEPERGIALADEAVVMAHESGDPREEPPALLGLGNALYQCEAFEQAAAHYSRCVELALDQEQQALAAQAMANLGHTFLVRQDEAQAIQCYQVAATFQQKLGNPLARAYDLTWLGEAKRRQEDLDGAQEALEQAVAICRGYGEQFPDLAAYSEADALQRLAMVHEQKGEQQEQRQCLERAAELGATAPPPDTP